MTNTLHFATKAAFTVSHGRKTAPLALIDLRGVALKRPFLLVVRLLRMAGFDVAISADFRSVMKAGSYALKAFDDPRVRFSPFGIRRADIVISNNRSRRGRARKFLLLDFNVFPASSRSGDGIFFPISFHPDYLDAVTIETVGKMPLRDHRDIGIFFAGNFAKEAYDRPETGALFDLLSRYRIVETLRARYGGSSLVEPKSIGELKSGISDGAYRKKIVICDSALFRIAGLEWFDVLRKCDFWLSPPGVVQPYCHNTVEAMAAGAIPILQYPSYYAPPLRHGAECIAFTEVQGLLRAVDAILEGRYEEGLPQMRVSARDYFNNWLSPAAFARSIKEFMISERRESRLLICQNTLSVALFEQTLKSSGKSSSQ